MTDPITGITTVEEDVITGDLFIIFPEEIVKAAGMSEGDSVEWADNGDGTFTITRAEGDDTESE
jgi:bifunctional DNA-binding transcriptional regulator/antitoxin component of YhaV-PrlF toxin-antitoxin module